MQSFFPLNGYKASPSEPQIRGNELGQGKGKITYWANTILKW